VPTINDVAASAKVSTATVSRVLSNPEMVAEATRVKVLKAIAQLGYMPNAAAKSLRTAATRKLLVTVPDIANPFFSLIIQGIEETAQREGYSVLLGDTHHDSAVEDKYGLMLQRREADGLIFLGHRLPNTVKTWMRGQPNLPPVVNGCEYSRSLGVPSAHIDNAAAAGQMMDHLYGLGHRLIGLVTGPLASPLSRDRLRGAMARARAEGAARQVTTANGDFSIQSGIACAARLLAQPKPPTAIFCFNDEMAIGVLDYAHRTGRRVPDSLSIAGFDDIRFARYAHPALTTISQPMLDIGRETVRLVLGILQGSVEKALSITLPHRLELRDSTAAVSRHTD
jgi:LacI family transcriptional regulator, repressor for deo operon, udp, cdd, tsx, nupC, and nupG